MKCPNYIKEALRKRSNFAAKFNVYDHIISNFVIKHDIEVEDYDILGGCESIVNPLDSSERVLEAILAKEEL